MFVGIIMGLKEMRICPECQLLLDSILNGLVLENGTNLKEDFEFCSKEYLGFHTKNLPADERFISLYQMSTGKEKVPMLVWDSAFFQKYTSFRKCVSAE